MRIGAPLVRFAERSALPALIAYLASAALYIYQIVDALKIRSASAPPLLFSQGRLAGDFFALAGSLHWILFGVNHRTSRPAAVGSLILAGLHLLLFAVRAYLVPILWVMEQTSR